MIFIYIPVCHWIWGGGFLAKIGVMDFAGGIVIHVSAGFAALASVIFLGRRDDMKPGEPTVPNNLPLVAVGAGLLWFGWFGFNAGGAYAADGLAAYAFTNTTIAGSIAMIVWMLYDWHYGSRAFLLRRARRRRGRPRHHYPLRRVRGTVGRDHHRRRGLLRMLLRQVCAGTPRVRRCARSMARPRHGRRHRRPAPRHSRQQQHRQSERQHPSVPTPCSSSA